jgi:hypothetical protein
MFNSSVRSVHEADDAELIGKIIDAANGAVSASELSTFVRDRDRRLCLDVDSSQLNFFILDQILAGFPDARFVLTIRDCYSWLNSFIDDSLRRKTTKAWLMLRDYRFRPDVFAHPPEEEPLRRRGLYALDGYLSYWARHNHKVISTVPASKLLIVRTHEISKRAADIAAFAGLPPHSVSVDQSHTNRNPQRFNVLRELDKHHIEEKVRAHCAPLMAQFFPEIKGMNDARI